jgi:hypothetical protein
VVRLEARILFSSADDLRTDSFLAGKSLDLVADPGTRRLDKLSNSVHLKK